MAAVPYTWFRGKRMTPAFRDAILAAEGRAGFTFTITQGGFNAGGVAASAGTHDGDAADFSVRGLTEARIAAMIEALRWAGIAAWFRTTKQGKYGVRPQGFGSFHVHAVPNGWGRPSAGAARQAGKYRQGRDGLAANYPDIGPGHTRAYYARITPGKPTPPGLPNTGNSQTTKPNPPTPPKEDTLSAAEKDAIIAEVRKEGQATRAYMDGRVQALGTLLGGRKKLDEIAATVVSFMRSRGLGDAEHKRIAKATATAVWDDSTVGRGDGGKIPSPMRQEMADAVNLAKRNLTLNIAANEAKEQQALGVPIDYDRIGRIVDAALADLEAESVTTTTTTIGGKK